MGTQRIEMATLSEIHTSDRSRRRMKRRHWAEFRLKAYGILAIGLAIAALLVLLWTIVSKTLGVTEEYYVSLQVDLALSEREAAPILDDNPQTNADLKGPIRDALKEAAASELKGRGARPLYDLVAGYEGYTLSSIVASDRELIGGRYQFDALLSDDAQMYLKGMLGRLERMENSDPLGLEIGDGNATLSFEPGTFTEARQRIAQTRTAQAARLRRGALDQARAFTETEALAKAATNDEDRDRLLAQAGGYAAARDEALAKAAALEEKATDADAVFTLDSSDPSVFVRTQKGWIKLSELGVGSARGSVMDAPRATGEIAPGGWTALMMVRPEAERTISDRQLVWLETFEREGRLVEQFNWRILSDPDSREAEYAGIWTALVGSFWTMVVTFLLAFPIGVMASIYLEEFAPKNRLTNFIEVNINNLAAVPSIVFGLLGLTVLLTGVSLFGVDLFDGLLKAFTDDPRSTPLAGGVVLALMSLPTIIIASRAAIKAVPPSIRDAALGLGASRLQTATHHVLPLAMPGILTGSIIAMAQALGETAPLIIIGMNSFVQEPPSDPLEPASVLPSLVYLWNNNPERLFEGKTAAAISVLLIFLILMNALAVLLRKRFERRW